MTQDTVTGFILAGIGHRNVEGQNFLIVKPGENWNLDFLLQFTCRQNAEENNYTLEIRGVEYMLESEYVFIAWCCIAGEPNSNFVPLTEVSFVRKCFSDRCSTV